MCGHFRCQFPLLNTYSQSGGIPLKSAMWQVRLYLDKALTQPSAGSEFSLGFKAFATRKECRTHRFVFVLEWLTVQDEDTGTMG